MIHALLLMALTAPPPTIVVRADESRPLVLEEPRTNSLIVVGTPRQARTVERLVRRLDRPARVRGRDIRVLKLHHADAADLKPLLDALFTKPKRKKRPRRKRR